MRELSKLTDKEVYLHAIVRLGLGSNPIENWGRLFDPAFGGAVQDQVLANRSFSIRFPTSLDFISARSAMKAIQDEAKRRGLAVDQIATLYFTLADLFEDVASTLSREEQIFLRDRRLQNVHGSLEYFLSDTPSVKWFDPSQRAVVVEKIPEEDLHYKVLKPFNLDHGRSQFEIRTRVVASVQWRKVRKFWKGNLTLPHLRELTITLGVAPGAVAAVGWV